MITWLLVELNLPLFPWMRLNSVSNQTQVKEFKISKVSSSGWDPVICSWEGMEWGRSDREAVKLHWGYKGCDMAWLQSTQQGLWMAVWYWPAFPAYCPSVWMTGPFKVNAAGEGLFSTLRPIIWRDAPQDGVSMSWSSLSNSGSVESRPSGSLSGWWSCLYVRDFKRKLCHRGCMNAREPATKWIFRGLLYVVDLIQDETTFCRWRVVV